MCISIKVKVLMVSTCKSDHVQLACTLYEKLFKNVMLKKVVTLNGELMTFKG